MSESKTRGRLTIPTDLDVVDQTLDIMRRWGADALRDADGTEFPQELRDANAKIYATYYTTRKDNEWARENPDEIQQCYICTSFRTATETRLSIRLMEGVSTELLEVNTRDDIKRWWEVMDRTAGDAVPGANWNYDFDTGEVVVDACTPFHEYSVSFLAYIIWDPVNMYNATVNDWQGHEHQLTFDVRQPKTRAWSKKRLRDFLRERPYVNVVRFTTFFHQFTLLFDELRREKYVDWYGYSASVSPYILQQFEAEVGYAFRPEFIIDEGYYNNQYRIPSKEYKDFMAFQRREVAALAKELVDITHEEGREAMMFLGDHWIGTEPFMEEFKRIGLDAVVGSVGNGSTLRLISDIRDVKYTEGRFLPYFFPDTFHAGGDPVREARENWMAARRAILRNPVDRIGYGGYLKLALDFPDFVEYIAEAADEFRELYDHVNGCAPYCLKRAAILNCWGKMRSWGCHMVSHALYQRENYSYAGVTEALSGAPFDIRFISFDDILADASALDGIDVLINVGDAYTAHSGGRYWADERVLRTVRSFIHGGGGFIGIGEPSACQHQGRFFQLAEALGVEKETGFTLGCDKYNTEVREHFITQETREHLNFGEGKKGIYALPEAEILSLNEGGVQMAANRYGTGRCVYMTGLPFDFENSRMLYRAILWSCNSEDMLYKWFSDNPFTELHAYLENGKYCVANNTYRPQSARVYADSGATDIALAPGEIRWFDIVAPHTGG